MPETAYVNHVLSLPVAGVTPMTTLDYPGHLACVLFTQGCPLRCGYCHNPQLIPRNAVSAHTWPEIEAFLERRRGLLEAVVFSGGEPTLHPAIIAAAERVKAMGYKIGLHTAGVYPQRLARLLPLLDWVGLDIKALPEDYDRVCGRPGMAVSVAASLTQLQASTIDWEVRTTVHPLDFDPARIALLLEQLADAGVERCALQLARPGQCLDPAYATHPGFAQATLENLLVWMRPRFTQLELRT
ncbi:anaerobic ribonucleoside-triphosphate reductase activating protein [Halomonas shantousis]